MHGHQAGDTVLLMFAEVLRKCIRMSDVAARYGGEEFVVLLPDTAKENAQVVAEIRAAIESHPFPGGRIPLSTRPRGAAGT